MSDLKQASSEKNAPESPRLTKRRLAKLYELEALKSKHMRENDEMDDKYLVEVGGSTESTEIKETRKRQKREKDELAKKQCVEIEDLFNKLPETLPWLMN